MDVIHFSSKYLQKRILVLISLVLSIHTYTGDTVYSSIDESASNFQIKTNYSDALNQSFRSVSDIPIGAAVDPNLLRNNPAYKNLVSHHFSSITPENAMKMQPLVNVQDNYQWTDADLLVDFAEQNDASVHGHTLVWHNQLPSWVNTYSGSYEDLLKKHSQTVLGHFKGRIQYWDVVNEAVLDSGSGYRNTIWFEKIGPDYIADAFRWAHQADPDAKLFYNDYSLSGDSQKLDFVVKK